MYRKFLLERIIDAYTPKIRKQAADITKKLHTVKPSGSIPAEKLQDLNMPDFKVGTPVTRIRKSKGQDPVSVVAANEVNPSPDMYDGFVVGRKQAHMMANVFAGMTIPPKKRGQTSKVIINRAGMRYGFKNLADMMGKDRLSPKGREKVAQHLVGHELVHSQSPHLTRSSHAKTARKNLSLVDKMGPLAPSLYHASPEETRAYTSSATYDLMQDYKGKKYNRETARKHVTSEPLHSWSKEMDSGKLTPMSANIMGARAAYAGLRDLRGTAKQVNDMGVTTGLGLNMFGGKVEVPGRVAKRGRKAYKQFHKGLHQNFELAYPQKERKTRRGSLTMAPTKPKLPEDIRQDILAVLTEASIDHVTPQLYRTALKVHREARKKRKDRSTTYFLAPVGRAREATGERRQYPGQTVGVSAYRLPKIAQMVGIGGLAHPGENPMRGMALLSTSKRTPTHKASFDQKQTATHELVHLADVKGMEQAKKTAAKAVAEKGSWGVIKDRIGQIIGARRGDPKAMKGYTQDTREAHAYTAVAGTLGVRQAKRHGASRNTMMNTLRKGNLGYQLSGPDNLVPVKTNSALAVGDMMTRAAQQAGGKKGKKIRRKFTKEMYKGIERAYPEHRPTYSTGMARATKKPLLPESINSEDRKMLNNLVVERIFS